MSRRRKYILGWLVIAVIVAAVYFQTLRDSVMRLARPARTEQQARREVVQPPIATPTDVKVKAILFWASKEVTTALDAVEVELPLSADPALRARQLISALISNPPSPEQRTLPADAALLQFYLLPDGTAVADFSDPLATATPSGILSEQMAADSIVRTLEANVEPVRRLKILIHGQEVDTLAGHLDLTGFFTVRAEAPAEPAATPAKASTDKLTPSAPPGKLSR